MRLSAVALAPVLFIVAGAGAQTFPATQPATRSARLPVPDDAAQDKARLALVSAFKSDLARTDPASRQALAQRLLVQGVATNDNPTMRYVALDQALDLASLAGDPTTAFRAAAEISRLYMVDDVDIKKRSLFRSNAVELTPEAGEAVSRLALDTADEAALADDFRSVEQLVNMGEAAAEKTKRIPFIASIQVRLADLRSLMNDYPHIQAALAHLATDPDDPAEQLEVGRFYALRKGQWDLGLPHLARGGDDRLRGLAVRDLAAPSEGTEQYQLAEAWWSYAQSSKGIVRTNVENHAKAWYRLARQNLKGITLALIDSRLNDGAPVAGDVSGTAGSAAINLLPLIDTAKDVVEGKWTFANDVLECTVPSRHACIALPYALPDEYDLRIVFARTEGEGPLTILLAGHNKSFDFTLDAKGFARFERVANTIAKGNPTAVPVAISNNHRYALTVQIRHDRVAALLDGKLLVERKTDYKDLSRYAVWKLPDENLCAIGSNNSKVSIFEAELVEVAGKGHPMR